MLHLNSILRIVQVLNMISLLKEGYMLFIILNGFLYFLCESEKSVLGTGNTL